MSDYQSRFIGVNLALVAITMLGACSSFNSASTSVAGVLTPYKMDIVQGNFVSREQAAAVKPGMSKLQVREILGTPLLTSVFHADRWDYVFSFRRQGAQPQARRVSVFFKGDLLDRMEADALPTEAEFVAMLDSGRSQSKVPQLELSAQEISQLPMASKAVESKTLAPLPISYPPLEARDR